MQPRRGPACLHLMLKSGVGALPSALLPSNPLEAMLTRCLSRRPASLPAGLTHLIRRRYVQSTAPRHIHEGEGRAPGRRATAGTVRSTRLQSQISRKQSPRPSSSTKILISRGRSSAADGSPFNGWCPHRRRLKGVYRLFRQPCEADYNELNNSPFVHVGRPRRGGARTTTRQVGGGSGPRCGSVEA